MFLIDRVLNIPYQDSIFYRENLGWTKKFVQNNIDKIEYNHKLYPNRNKWNCDCHVIHDYDNDLDLCEIDFHFLRKKYTEFVNKFCQKNNLKLKHISDIWYNYYKKYQYQEPHDHGNINGYTAVHYMILDPKNHSSTKFVDKNIKTPEVKQGDILIFPANLFHYVPANYSEAPRLTTAFTFVLE